jgi:hypothetical protein
MKPPRWPIWSNAGCPFSVSLIVLRRFAGALGKSWTPLRRLRCGSEKAAIEIMNFVVDTSEGLCYFLIQVWWLFFVPVGKHDLSEAIIDVL